MHAESSDVGTSLARNPENCKIALLVELEELGLVNGTYAKLALYGRDERGALEERAGESLDSTREGGGVWECCMDAEDGDILLSC